jgi:hypothetical protein
MISTPPLSESPSPDKYSWYKDKIVKNGKYRKYLIKNQTSL